MANKTPSSSLSIGHHHTRKLHRRHDDLILEPSGDYDLVYGDESIVMSDNENGVTEQRPYIRLNSFLSNTTKETGNEVRFKCEAAGAPLPLNFQWLKNHVPLEKQKRIKIRNREYTSKLTITDLDVLDSGFYQCVVSNVAGSVNSTAVLRVNKASTTNTKKPFKGKSDFSLSGEEISNDYFDEMDSGRLIEDEDRLVDGNSYTMNNEDTFSPNYNSNNGIGIIDQWLNNVQLKVGECIPYQGSACKDYLDGRYILVTSDNREDIYDIDRNLRAANRFIQNMRGVKGECKQYSHAVACYHMFKVCDTSQVNKGYRRGYTSNTQYPPPLISLCYNDCEKLTNDLCSEEVQLASAHDLVGDGPKAMIPKCNTLPLASDHCFSLLDKPINKNYGLSQDMTEKKKKELWCYIKDGQDYKGTINTSKSGRACRSWIQSSSPEFNVIAYPELKLSKNYCRNPGGKRTAPWCYVGNGEEELCSVSQCPKSIGFDDDNDGSLTTKFTKMWEDIPPQQQLMALLSTGFVTIILLIIIICCVCCCKKGKKNNVRRNGGCNNGTIEGKKHLLGTAHDETQTTTTYNRMTNQIKTSSGVGIDNGISSPYEISSLLSRGTNPYNSNNQGHILQHGVQFSQHSQPSTEPPVEPYHIPEIQPQSIKIGSMIGEGQFSGIYIADYYSSNHVDGDIHQTVVVSLKSGCTMMEKQSFEENIKALASFDHQNILKLIGVSYLDFKQITGIFDYQVHGDLHEFLKVRAPANHIYDVSDNEDFLKIAIQIAQGMDYLASNSYVHQDLATRNIYVSDQRTIKICAFQMIKKGYEKDYYKPPHRFWMPIRWMSKETIQHARYTTASDVWAFGVTLWELFTYGKTPYGDYSNEDVIEMINLRNLLECPSNCPSSMYSLMIECWNEHPERRPSFNEIFTRLQSWCISGAMQQPFLQFQTRASSSISGGSGGQKTTKTNSSNQSNSLRNNGGPITNTINGVLYHNSNGSSGTSQHSNPTKLNGFMHSTPISQTRNVKKHSDFDSSPLMRRPNGNFDYSEDDADEDSD
uniref:receptor protein-tyrosine kinase n=1 Tax=Strongyloides stercoralis TaxID=6248 RepID=A0A0K0ELA5_STRER